MSEKKGIFHTIKEGLLGEQKKTIEKQMEDYNIVTKRSNDSIRAELAAVSIMEELATKCSTDSPSKYLFDLWQHTKNACAILDSQILNMLRLADKEYLKPRITLFHNLSEERLAWTFENALYLQEQEKLIEKRKNQYPKDWKQSQIAENWSKARVWATFIYKYLHSKIRDLLVEAWSNLDKTGEISFTAYLQGDKKGSHVGTTIDDTGLAMLQTKIQELEERLNRQQR